MIFVLQLFKAVTFEIDHEPKVSFLHFYFSHFYFIFMTTVENNKCILLLMSSGTLDSSCEECEEARLFFHHKNLPGLPTVYAGNGLFYSS